LSGSLTDAAGNPIIPTIPVAFTSFDIGQTLYNQYQQAVQNNTALPVMNLAIKGIVKPNTDDYNVIADSKGGDPNHVVVVDAHLDAIYGAGMLDNASGSATILDIAQMMRKVHPRNKLRFIWFGGEELGLLGSTAGGHVSRARKAGQHRGRHRNFMARLRGTAGLGLRKPVAAPRRVRLRSLRRPRTRRGSCARDPRHAASAIAIVLPWRGCPRCRGRAC
jgi:hypothetical protein